MKTAKDAMTFIHRSQPPDEPYEAIAARQQAAALLGHFKIIRDKGEQLLAQARSTEENMVGAANSTREIGLELRAALDRQQLRFEEFNAFFRQHAAALPPWLTPDAAHKFLAAAEKYPAPIRDLKTALEILEQMTFFAVGLLEEPKRTLQQTAVAQAPLERVVGVSTKLDETINRFLEEFPEENWNATTNLTMLDATRATAALHQRCLDRKKKLGDDEV